MLENNYSAATELTYVSVSLPEVIRSRGRPISNSPVSEGASSSSSPNNEPLMEESEQSHFPEDYGSAN